jgi:cyclopropane fatty-acyl-phospholipid synthase-like methyltransferase
MKISRYILNKIVRILRYVLYKIFKFDKWHLSTFQERSYAKSIVSYLNVNASSKRLSMVEIGCGLGDIIRRIKIKNKLGLDVDEKALKAAKLISYLQVKFNIKYELFVFPTSSLFGLYDVIIMVNWIHNIEPKELKEKLEEYFFNNLNSNGEIIIDTVQDKEYRYNHSITYLTSALKAQVFKIGDFERQREVFSIIKRGQ